MSYFGRVSVSYGPRLTRLERARAADAGYDRMVATLDGLETVWNRSSGGVDERRDACAAATAAVTSFVVAIGLPLHAKERLNDVMVAFGELYSGRHAGLFTPAPVHPGKFSPTDLAQQATAQVCVDFLREAGLPAAEARRKTSQLFGKHKLPKFGESKLRALNSRLSGRGCTEDKAYDFYVWAKSHAREVLEQLGMSLPLNPRTAFKAADRLIAMAKRRDHRRDFFFASREDSSQMP